MVVRNWRDVHPTVGHNGKLIWSLLNATETTATTATTATGETGARLQGFQSLTLHRQQGGGEGDYHEHADKEQVYFFLAGRGRMKIGEQWYDVREGDAVQVPPKTGHQLINTTDDWIEHLIITARVHPPDATAA